jgi:acyl-CoA dehydrogenase
MKAMDVDIANTQRTADEVHMIADLHAFVDSTIMPIQAEIRPLYENPRLYYDERGVESRLVTEARRQARMESAKAGYYTMFCPTEFGGANRGLRAWFLCWESLFHRYGAPPTQLPFFILSHFTSGPHEVWQFASESLKAEIIPSLASGKLQGAFALSEPSGGSDSFSMTTSAVREGDNWVINGRKQWTSWAPVADFVMVYAVTNRELLTARKGGITCFYVPTNTPGYKLESVIPMFGKLGGDEAAISLNNVRIPDHFRVGDIDQGFKLAMLGVRHGRLANAGRTLGLARWALDKAVKFAKNRQAFGVPIAEHQTIQNYLAESAVDLYAGRAMALDCATRIDRGEDARAEVSMVKAFTTKVAFTSIDRSMQIHGALGLANDTGLTEAWMNTRMTHVAEGTNEIQLRSIAQLLLSDRINLGFN